MQASKIVHFVLMDGLLETNAPVVTDDGKS